MSFTWATLYAYTGLTLAQFRTNLRTRIDEDTQDTTTNTQLDELIKSAIDAINLKAKTFFSYCTDTIVSGTTSYDLPAAMGEIYEVYVLDSSSNPTYLVPMNDGESPDASDSYWYIRAGNTIVISQYLTSGTLKIWGQKKVDRAAATYLEIPNEYAEAYYAYCEYNFWKRRRDFEAMKVAYEIYKDSLQAIIDDIEDNKNKASMGYGQKG